MKPIILAIIAVCSSISVFSQTTSSAVSHEGFYLLMAGGPTLGKIKGDNNGKTSDVKGIAPGFDFQIGGAIKPNLILHATAQNKTLMGPKINNVKQDIEYFFQEIFYGVGVTKYTKENFFVTGNVGVAHFSESEDITRSAGTDTDAGFSFSVKAGKEWMVSKRWGLGGALFYGRTTLTNSGFGYSAHWSSNRFGIYFQATLCKSK